MTVLIHFADVLAALWFALGVLSAVLVVRAPLVYREMKGVAVLGWIIPPFWLIARIWS